MSELHGLTFEKDDKLQRKVYAESLTDFLFANKDDVDVACINAPWGTGKTWFVHMWKNYIADEFSKNEDGTGIVPVYYNSWENDDYPNALIPLIAEIKTQLFPEKTGVAINKFAKASGAILKDAAYNALNLATAGLLDFRIGSEAANELKDEDLFERSIAQYSTNITEKKKFKESLEAIIKEEIKTHVFVFVDELDRCRPTFAIETLERIKHFFDIEGITFIILLDKEQLSHSVKVLYGSECDTAGYLLRFFDIEYNLPRISKLQNINSIFNHRANFAAYIRQIGSIFELSLRDYQKISLWLKAFTKTVDLEWLPFTTSELQIVGYLMLTKLKYPEKYLKFCRIDEINYTELPKSKEVDIYYLQAVSLDLINCFVRACDFVNGKKNWNEVTSGLAQDQQNFLRSLSEKNKCQLILDALSLMEPIDF